MNLIFRLKNDIVAQAKKLFGLSDEHFKHFEFKINADADQQFGDLSCNVAMILAKSVGRSPRDIAMQFQQELVRCDEQKLYEKIDIAGPGFLNITLSSHAWLSLIHELMTQGKSFFTLHSDEKRCKYLIEFVSANPTGPLHLGHGRGGIIGDTLARVLAFLGHHVDKEFYINDAGNQIVLLGLSLKARCLQQLGHAESLPEGGYAGEYLVDLANDCIAQYGKDVVEKSDQFFQLYAKEQLLGLLKGNLADYGITFDTWFSEKNLHDDGSVEGVLADLRMRDLVYDHEGAVWFKSSQFGDDKDRVVKKGNGELTYIAADIAYHKNKFDRGYDVLIDIMGHDHHGYVRRLKATMQALGYNQDQLDVILYQLVTIKDGDVAVKMSKRAGTFTKLSDVIESVGKDVARFFYLNRKCDIPLDFDLEVASQTTDENPVYYIQYAYVRLNSLLQKARLDSFREWINSLESIQLTEAELNDVIKHLDYEALALLKKVISLHDILRSIIISYQTHMLSYYALELAQKLHTYYTKHKIIDASQMSLSKARMLVMIIVRNTLALSLDLLGLQKPEKM